MSKTIQQMEARLARLEREMAELKATFGNKPGRRWYRQIVGDFAGDPVFAQIVRLGSRLRGRKLRR